MGPGGSQEAPYSLKAKVPAGSYHVQCDAIVIKPIDVTFSLIWRTKSGTDTVLSTWMQHFEPLAAGSFHAQPYELDVAGTAIDYASGDQLIFKYEGANTTSMEAFIPNGDGEITGGRIPAITLPGL